MPAFPAFESSIERILARNHEWADGLRRLNPETLHHLAENGQKPEVLWIGCADSRVPESVVTASMPGDIFVHRNIANQFSADDKSAASAVQFAVENLHVSYVFVVGHTQCGGVAAALRDAHPPDSVKPKNARNAALGDWLAALTSLAVRHGIYYPGPDDKAKLAERLAALTERNVTNAMEQVKGFIERWKDAADERQASTSDSKWVTIVGLVYDLETGVLGEVGQRIQAQAFQRKVTARYEECSEELSEAECTC